jgi:hypothetical protein
VVRLVRRHYLVFGITWAIGFAVAVFAPDDVLARHAGLQSFVDHLAIAIPSLKVMGSRSDFPEVTRLYHAVAWLFVPFYALLMLRSMLRRDGRVLKEDARAYLDEYSLKTISVVVLLQLMFAAILVFLLDYDDGRDIYGSQFNTSRLFLGFFGLITPLAAALAIAGLAFQILLLLHAVGLSGKKRK